MSDRDAVFASIRAALAGKNREPVPHPEWETAQVLSKAGRDASDMEALFAGKLESTAAKIVRGWDELAAFLEAECAGKTGYADPALDAGSKLPGATIETTLDRARIDDYAFGITRASLGIAESGTLVLKDADTSSRLGSLAPWVHIAVLNRNDIVLSISEALARLGDERYTVFVTGPSKTGDVEGILIKGVHGPGVQVCCLV